MTERSLVLVDPDFIMDFLEKSYFKNELNELG